jgi:hypothetical protein
MSVIACGAKDRGRLKGAIAPFILILPSLNNLSISGLKGLSRAVVFSIYQSRIFS